VRFVSLLTGGPPEPEVRLLAEAYLGALTDWGRHSCRK
jgi:hypothetical protein